MLRWGNTRTFDMLTTRHKRDRRAIGFPDCIVLLRYDLASTGRRRQPALARGLLFEEMVPLAVFLEGALAGARRSWNSGPVAAGGLGR
jgi:hypothetical protein